MTFTSVDSGTLEGNGGMMEIQAWPGSPTISHSLWGVPSKDTVRFSGVRAQEEYEGLCGHVFILSRFF